MKQLILAASVLAIVCAAVSFSRQGGPGPLQVERQGRNPWTNDRLNNDPADFQFAIVSDRTGGHRAKIFSRAVERLNLLQPEFVVSVGDLIEGGAKKPEALEQEWKEFDGYVNRLQMPFFYVPGNHDTGNQTNDKTWQERYGRRWYHFVYRDVLFLCLNTDDPPGSGVGHLGNEQVAYARKVLAANKDVRWTLVFLHKPVWTAADLKKRGWPEVESALADRPYTVFAGHIHRYQKFVRQGRAYYQLATTGGGSKLRGVDYGEFDQVVWVTMKKDGPVLANLLLDSILPEDLRLPESKEEGVKRKKYPTVPVRGLATLDGTPLVGVAVVLTPTAESAKTGVRADAVSEADGTFVPSTYSAGDGMAPGKYTATLGARRPLVPGGARWTSSPIPAKYGSAATSGLVVTVPPDGGEVRLELTSGGGK